MNAMLAAGKMVLDPIVPVPLVVLLGILLGVGTLYVYVTVGAEVGRGRNAFLTCLRLVSTLLLLLLLLQPSTLEQIPSPTIDKVTLVAVDTSRSMRQGDVGSLSRLDAARKALSDASLVTREGLPGDGKLRLFEFSEDAVPVNGPVQALTPKGASTRFHRSVMNMLGSLSSGEGARALVLLTDGHDFDLVNPAKTGFLARSRQVPIFAVPFGKQGKVRDVSAHITSYQPYYYVKQKARLTASLRVIGCEYEDIQVQLLRQNQVVQTQRLNAEEQQQLTVQFEVVEPKTGQYEYEIRAVPLTGEADTANNSAITFLNIVDQQIQALLLEGSPYWDTTFLQRSLLRNDKVDLDALVQYAPSKVHRTRKKAGAEELRLPVKQEEFNHYDVILLGRGLDAMMSGAEVKLLEKYVKDYGGTVIFCRGKAFDQNAAGTELEPVIWGETSGQELRLQVGREGQQAAPMRALGAPGSALDNLPSLIAGHKSSQKKPLTATLATVQGADGGEPEPGIVHRRFGSGQVVSIGVEGLWRWGFNAKVEGPNTYFDRFWDQMMLWLMADRDFVPTQQYSFRTSTANLLLGEKIYFRLLTRNPNAKPQPVPLTIYAGDRAVGKTSFAIPTGEEQHRQMADYLPERNGRYRAVATFPDGTTQEAHFMVYSENLEDTEVATDAGYLKRLCESSGGRLLSSEELGHFMTELRDQKVDTTPKTRLTTLWDRTWIFYGIGLLFAIDWHLRRKWGLC